MHHADCLSEARKVADGLTQRAGGAQQEKILMLRSKKKNMFPTFKSFEGEENYNLKKDV